MATDALAGTAGVDPQGCSGITNTIGGKTFNVDGRVMYEEIRHSTGCGNVGWGRLSQVGGTNNGNLALVQTAWNPGGPSQDGMPNSNWTRTVNAAG